jgi:hypothetical protein
MTPKKPTEIEAEFYISEDGAAFEAAGRSLNGAPLTYQHILDTILDLMAQHGSLPPDYWKVYPSEDTH